MYLLLSSHWLLVKFTVVLIRRCVITLAALDLVLLHSIENRFNKFTCIVVNGLYAGKHSFTGGREGGVQMGKYATLKV